MALYAFDGTWNHEHSAGEYGKNTNVVKFRDAYIGKLHFYTKGVGTKLGFFGKLFGGAFGAGGRERIHEASHHLYENYAQGDKDIDIIGFSRGAALALEFAHVIYKKGVRNPKTGACAEAKPAVRFLGLWDVVAAFGIPINLFGIPFQRINLGYHLELSPLVQHCFHAMALDERRPAFRNTRVTNGDEVWFRGVHSDVGGGNENPTGLSHIALRWMFRKALAIGVPIDRAKVDEISKSVNPEQVIYKNTDPFEGGFRTIKALDRIHYSVLPQIGCNIPPATCTIESENDERNPKWRGNEGPYSC